MPAPVTPFPGQLLVGPGLHCRTAPTAERFVDLVPGPNTGTVCIRLEALGDRTLDIALTVQALDTLAKALAGRVP